MSNHLKKIERERKLEKIRGKARARRESAPSRSSSVDYMKPGALEELFGDPNAPAIGTATMSAPKKGGNYSRRYTATELGHLAGALQDAMEVLLDAAESWSPDVAGDGYYTGDQDAQDQSDTLRKLEEKITSPRVWGKPYALRVTDNQKPELIKALEGGVRALKAVAKKHRTQKVNREVAAEYAAEEEQSAKTLGELAKAIRASKTGGKKKAAKKGGKVSAAARRVLSILEVAHGDLPNISKAWRTGATKGGAHFADAREKRALRELAAAGLAKITFEVKTKDDIVRLRGPQNTATFFKREKGDVYALPTAAGRKLLAPPGLPTGAHRVLAVLEVAQGDLPNISKAWRKGPTKGGALFTDYQEKETLRELERAGLAKITFTVASAADAHRVQGDIGDLYALPTPAGRKAHGVRG